MRLCEAWTFHGPEDRLPVKIEGPRRKLPGISSRGRDTGSSGLWQAEPRRSFSIKIARARAQLRPVRAGSPTFIPHEGAFRGFVSNWSGPVRDEMALFLPAMPNLLHA